MQPIEEVGHAAPARLGQEFLHRLAREVAELGIAHRRPRRADDLQFGSEQAVGVERAERRQQHPLGQIAGGPEQQQRVGFGIHVFGRLPFPFLLHCNRQGRKVNGSCYR